MFKFIVKTTKKIFDTIALMIVEKKIIG